MKKIYLYLILVLFSFHFEAFGQTISTDKNAVIHSKLRVATTNEADASDPTKALITINYSDGLGRHLQTVGYQQSPTQKDIITGATTYDKYGRATVSVLPVPATSGTGAYQSNAIGLGQSFYGDNRPYSSVSTYDNSPLNRERETIGAGQTWATNNKKTQIFNESAGTDIRFYKLDGSNNIILSGTYPTNSLYKKRIIDEQGHTSIEITDKRGRLVQKQQQDDTGYITTYYLNDGLGRVLATIQPEGYELNASINYNSTEWNRWVFFYQYDYRGRLIEKKTPGTETEYMVYDKWDRMVWHQTAQQREKGLWTFKKYDGLNRLIISGEKSESRNRVDLQAEASAWSGSRYESRVGGGIYYSYSNAYPQLFTTADIREVFFYDDYTAWLPSGMGFDGANAYHSQHPEFHTMATGGMVRNTENGNFMTYANYYDNKRRIIQTFAHNLYGKAERTDFQYNFAGDVLEIKSLLFDENNVANVQVERFEYDNVGSRTVFKVAMNAAPSETVCSYEYNEIRQLKTKKYYPNRQYGQIPTTPEFIIRPPSPTAQNTQDIAKRYILLQPNTVINASNLNSYLAQIGQGAVSNVVVQGLQTMNFGHHVRGMMNCVNCVSGLPVLDDTQNDIFANKLNFEENNLFDGNISKEIWKSKLNTGSNRSYTHTYDAAKRILASAYIGDMYSNENFNFSVNGYDKNGNIKGLNRNGARALSNGIPTTFGAIDQLTYFYNGNRLTGVTDGATGNEDVGDFRDNNSSSDYTYWTDGSLKSDANKGISLIDFDTYLNKPKSVTYSDGRWIRFYYSSNGTKIKQTNSANEEFHYTPKSIYQRKNNVTALYQISQSEGRVLPITGGFVFEFQYNDHLGNLRVSFRDSLAAPVNGVYPPPVITQENTYFPFGLEHRGTDFYRSFGLQNQFQYNGKEKVSMFNLGWSDYGFRSLDLQTVRFISSDPLASKFPELTNYQYASNNPILNIDLDGLEGLSFDNPFVKGALQNNVTSHLSKATQSFGESIRGSGTFGLGVGVSLKGFGSDVNLQAVAVSQSIEVSGNGNSTLVGNVGSLKGGISFLGQSLGEKSSSLASYSLSGKDLSSIQTGGLLGKMSINANDVSMKGLAPDRLTSKVVVEAQTSSTKNFGQNATYDIPEGDVGFSGNLGFFGVGVTANLKKGMEAAKETGQALQNYLNNIINQFTNPQNNVPKEVTNQKKN
jgi:RHS repeat-associated protein